MESFSDLHFPCSKITIILHSHLQFTECIIQRLKVSQPPNLVLDNSKLFRVFKFNLTLDMCLQTEKVDTLQNGRQLTYGEYRDACRPLKRFLKQLGSGSLEAGLAFILQHEDAQTNTSQLTGVDKQVLSGMFGIWVTTAVEKLQKEIQSLFQEKLLQSAVSFEDIQTSMLAEEDYRQHGCQGPSLNVYLSFHLYLDCIVDASLS